MKAIILAAGEGKRLRPHTENMPKPMIKVHGKSLLQYILESLPDEISEYILVVGYKKEVIQEFFGNSFKGKPITYITQEEKTGTAHALTLCKNHLAPEERFLLTYADDIYDKESITNCLNHEFAILTAESDEPERYATMHFREDGSVSALIEKPDKPDTNLIAPGVYIINTDIFNYEPVLVKGEYYFTTMLDQFMKDHKVFPENTNFWVTIGYPRDLELAEIKLANK